MGAAKTIQAPEAEPTCEECGAPIAKRTGRPPKTCSTACRNARESRKEKRRRLMRLSSVRRICPACDRVYTPGTDAQVLCSVQCQRSWQKIPKDERDRRRKEAQAKARSLPNGAEEAPGIRTCSAAPGGRQCRNPVTLETPICPEHMPKFTTTKPRPVRLADRFAWDGYSSAEAQVSTGGPR